jgi:hypothetical protein
MKRSWFFIFILAGSCYINQTQGAIAYSDDLPPIINQQQRTPGSDHLTVDERGKNLRKFYLSMNVENLWIAGAHIKWETGEVDKPDATTSIHTHCSAFVAATCQRLGLYILRPPQHGQELLANGQFDWLKTAEARQKGWVLITASSKVALYAQAQRMANTGHVVVAIAKNPDETKPGHAALVMPKEIDSDALIENGPMIIMAGKHNFNSISLKNGFKSHISVWPENEILFFVNNNAPAVASTQ